MENENEKRIIVGQQNKPIEQNIPKEFIDNEFITPTEEIELPSLGLFYPNGKKTVKVKYLTAEEDDVLFSPELIKSGRVLDALLQIVIVDKDLHPDDMIVGDRNAILVHVRKTGIGEEYMPGKMTCPSCGEQYEPVVDLNKLKLKYLENKPDQNGEYDFFLPLMKKNIKFRMMTGKDENKIGKATQNTSKKGVSSFKVSKGVTERYRLQIMEVEGNRDKLYISKLISAMPMKDSMVFREYTKLLSPGVDFNYNFECTQCGHHYEDEVPMTYRLFYPNADL
jgi:rubredoxin